MSSSSSSGASSAIPTPKNADDVEAVRRSRVLSSKLYFDVPLSKAPIIYASSYDISFLGIEKLHPFDSSKWGHICQFLTADKILEKKQIVEPLEPTKDDLLVVHSESYLDSLKSSINVSMIVEVPPVAVLPNFLVQKKVLQPFRKQVGGTVLSAKLAKERGWAINVGGGFHHCSAQKGGGFCAYADISICIQFAFVALNISRAMIIDLDAHQGNGHEIDFANERRVYVLDMYNPEIYPHDLEAKRYIDQKVEVKSRTETDAYLTKLDEALQVAEREINPDLIVYNAGTDILEGDPLGYLNVSPKGVVERDEKVFQFARKMGTPILMLTSDCSDGGDNDWEVMVDSSISDCWMGSEAIFIDTDGDASHLAPVREPEVIDLLSNQDCDNLGSGNDDFSIKTDESEGSETSPMVNFDMHQSIDMLNILLSSPDPNFWAEMYA